MCLDKLRRTNCKRRNTVFFVTMPTGGADQLDVTQDDIAEDVVYLDAKGGQRNVRKSLRKGRLLDKMNKYGMRMEYRK